MTLQSEIRRILDENQIVKNASRKEFLGLYTRFGSKHLSSVHSNGEIFKF